MMRQWHRLFADAYWDSLFTPSGWDALFADEKKYALIEPHPLVVRGSAVSESRCENRFGPRVRRRKTSGRSILRCGCCDPRSLPRVPRRNAESSR
jgi:hypothetical protein